MVRSNPVTKMIPPWLVFVLVGQMIARHSGTYQQCQAGVCGKVLVALQLLYQPIEIATITPGGCVKKILSWVMVLEVKMYTALGGLARYGKHIVAPRLLVVDT